MTSLAALLHLDAPRATRGDRRTTREFVGGGTTSRENHGDPDDDYPDDDYQHITIVDEMDADGSFALHSLVAHALKNQRRPVLVCSFAQIYAHYVAIGRKLVGSFVVLVLW